jgi:L-fuconolactonase
MACRFPRACSHRYPGKNADSPRNGQAQLTEITHPGDAMVVDTHVHVFTDDRKKYPQIRDTERAGKIPSITEIGQAEWPLTTVEILMQEMDKAGVDMATLVQAYFVYEYDNSYTIDAVNAYPDRFASVVVLDPMDPKSPDDLSRMVEKQNVAGIRFMRGRLPESSLGKPETFALWDRIEKLKIPLAINDRLTELPKLRKPMERYPTVKVALEHAWGHKVGAPPDYAHLEPLFSLADNPNLYIKTAINNIAAALEEGGTPKQLYTRLVEVFGARRIMWSSNYPAHPKFGSIKSRLDMAKAELAFLNETDRNWIFGNAALSVYTSLKR